MICSHQYHIDHWCGKWTRPRNSAGQRSWIQMPDRAPKGDMNGSLRMSGTVTKGMPHF